MVISHAQTLTYCIETGVNVGSGDFAPFWHTANRYGLSSEEPNAAYLSAGIFQEDKHPGRKWSYAYGVELAGAANHVASFLVQQAYVDLRYKKLQLEVGSKERGSEGKNDYLSTGGLIFSTNARPVPQVRIGFPEFVPVPGTGMWLHVKGHIAYGFFTDEGFQKDFVAGNPKYKYTENALYHSKALFLKLQNQDFPIEVTLGMEMAAQFGGTCYNKGKVISSPHGLKDFFKMLLGQSGGSEYSKSDQMNKAGNHLGSYHLAVGYQSQDWTLRAYYEHPFEDESGMGLTYGIWKDCLAGIELNLPKNRWMHALVVEYLYTKEQTGALHTPLKSDWVEKPFTGGDNYYNHSQFPGWEHWGQGMGNPLLTSPVYNANQSLAFRNNRVKGFHVGVSGQPAANWAYRLLLTATRNWGTYGTPFDDVMDNGNGLAEVSYTPTKLKGWTFTGSVAADRGSLLGNNIGGLLTIRKTGGIGR